MTTKNKEKKAETTEVETTEKWPSWEELKKAGNIQSRFALVCESVNPPIEDKETPVKLKGKVIENYFKVASPKVGIAFASEFANRVRGESDDDLEASVVFSIFKSIHLDVTNGIRRDVPTAAGTLREISKDLQFGVNLFKAAAMENDQAMIEKLSVAFPDAHDAWVIMVKAEAEAEADADAEAEAEADDAS